MCLAWAVGARTDGAAQISSVFSRHLRYPVAASQIRFKAGQDFPGRSESRFVRHRRASSRPTELRTGGVPPSGILPIRPQAQTGEAGPASELDNGPFSPLRTHPLPKPSPSLRVHSVLSEPPPPKAPVASACLHCTEPTLAVLVLTALPAPAVSASPPGCRSTPRPEAGLGGWEENASRSRFHSLAVESLLGCPYTGFRFGASASPSTRWSVTRKQCHFPREGWRGASNAFLVAARAPHKHTSTFSLFPNFVQPRGSGVRGGLGGRVGVQRHLRKICLAQVQVKGI